MIRVAYGVVFAMLSCGVAGCLDADLDDVAGQHGVFSTTGLAEGSTGPICRAELYVRPVATSSIWIEIGESVDLPLGAADAGIKSEPQLTYQGTSVYLSLQVGDDQSCQAALLAKPTALSSLMDVVGQPAAITVDPSDEVMTAEPITNSKNDDIYLLLWGG